MYSTVVVGAGRKPGNRLSLVCFGHGEKKRSIGWGRLFAGTNSVSASQERDVRRLPENLLSVTRAIRGSCAVGFEVT
jgi:hypothetical protein